MGSTSAESANFLPQHTALEARRQADHDSYVRRQNGLNKIRTEVEACSKCSLREHCKMMAHPDAGNGGPDQLIIVTAHPDIRDVNPMPAINKASPEYILLYRILHEIGAISVLSESPGVAMQNRGVAILPAVKCAPADATKIRDEHIKACLPWLGKQIGLVKPKIIVGLGSVALAALSGAPLSKCHVTRALGAFIPAPIPDTFMIFTVSPAYVIHRKHQNGGQARDTLKTVLLTAWRKFQDLRQSSED